MKRFLCLLAFVPGICLAGTTLLTWTPPLTNTDGSALTNLSGYRIEYGSCSGSLFGTKAGEWTQIAPASSSLSPNLAAGTYCFRVYARSSASTESVASNVTTKVIPPSVPNPPTNVTAVDPTVYEPRRFLWWTFAYEVGVVPLGTVCQANRFGSLYGVPSSKVTLVRRAAGTQFYARCA